MDPLEMFVVETTVPSEAGAYRSILEDVISELGFARSIGRLKVIIRPEDSLFVMALMLRSGLPPVKAGDILDSGEARNPIRVLIDVKQEQYMPVLIDKLLAEFGSDKVVQTQRSNIEIITGDPEGSIELINSLVVDDPAQTLRERLADMAIRSCPEGFRVRYHSLSNDRFIFVASEDTIEQEWIDEGHSLLEEIAGVDIHGSSA